ncbi:MAG TPA: PP2C family serine/threonine-protein phosphatase [Kineosporiaceae bacterium]|nr:PP2C family serine/threonine-protein phosphatase [Kineosporiaceae bacterium]
MAIALRYAARSDVGLVRQNNQDSGYAGPHLLVIADGMGGHAGGDVASSLAIGELAPLDGESHGSDDALLLLERAMRAAHAELLARVEEEPQLAGMGTTVTALLRSGNRLALAHIGDSRAYLLRDGVLTQITKDHTFVQTLVDEGRLTPEEAEHHPQRNVIMRVLSDVVDDPEPDLSMRETRVGDRYLLCSDGLSGVVSFETLQATLADGQAPGGTCERLVALARRAGAPDNVTCIVADVVDEPASADAAPSVVGAASVRSQRRPVDEGSSAAERAAALTAGGTDEADGDDLDDPRPRRAVVRLAGAAVVAAVLAGGAFGAWHWVRQQYFVGVYGDQVAVYRGLPQDLGPIDLATLDHTTGVLVDALPPADRDSVRAGLVVDNGDEATAKVEALRHAACDGVSPVSPTPSPSATPLSASGPAGTVTALPSATGVAPTSTGTALPGATSSPSSTASPSIPGPTASPSPGGTGDTTCAGVR